MCLWNVNRRVSGQDLTTSEFYDGRSLGSVEKGFDYGQDESLHLLLNVGMVEWQDCRDVGVDVQAKLLDFVDILLIVLITLCQVSIEVR